jgi:F-type H+-transporting ATPase subunit delta
MLKGAIARRYAEAMFEIALKQNTVDRTLEDVKGITQVFANRKLAYLLREPKVPAQRKEKALREGLGGTGGTSLGGANGASLDGTGRPGGARVLPTSLNLALLVVQRGLVDLMPNIAKELETLVLDYRNEAIAEVTTAAPMDQAQANLVKKALEHSTGKSIIMGTHVDPSILGGVIARVGDQLIDNSVRYRLQALERELLTGIATTSIDYSPEDFVPA